MEYLEHLFERAIQFGYLSAVAALLLFDAVFGALDLLLGQDHVARSELEFTPQVLDIYQFVLNPLVNFFDAFLQVSS